MSKEQEKKEGNKEPERKITFNIDKEKNFSEWFSEILQRAELIDIRYNVKGFEVFMPWATIIIEKMYDLFEAELQLRGHLPCIFPAVIPEENFHKEKEHIKGFEPDVFWITNAREGRLALRPTSETAFYQLYSLWIRSYKDLPLKLYQRANVWRNETKATRPLIRTREFYWIEAHDCFETREEAEKQVQEDIEITKKVMHRSLGIPFLPLKRPEWDKFAGAIYTIGSDSLMPDGRVIQQPSTHLLGENFSKAFNIKFKDKNGNEQYVWQTCYGPCISRIFASLISIHGDSSGLILPFSLAPIQVIIVPIYKKENKKQIDDYCKKLKNELEKACVGAKIDDSDKKPGEKFYFWEMKGVPLRLEIGEREIKNKEATLFLRDIKKELEVKEKGISKIIIKEGKNIDERLRKKADENFDKAIKNAGSKEEIKKILQEKKIARCNFCSIGKEGEKCAEVVEKELFGFVRGIRADKIEKPSGKCVICDEKAQCIVYIAKSY